MTYYALKQTIIHPTYPVLELTSLKYSVFILSLVSIVWILYTAFASRCITARGICCTICIAFEIPGHRFNESSVLMRSTGPLFHNRALEPHGSDLLFSQRALCYKIPLTKVPQ